MPELKPTTLPEPDLFETLDDDETLAPRPSGATSAGPDDPRAACAAQSARIPERLAGQRLDRVLAELFPSYSRSRLQAWLEAGRVDIDARVATRRDRAIADAELRISPAPAPQSLAFVPEDVPLDVIDEHPAFVVLNKAAGRVVHPAAGNWSGTLLNGLLHRYGAAAAALPRAGIVHRLDKDTSGLMVVARTLAAQTDLVRQLQARTVKRRYLALVCGQPPAHGTIDAPIGRDPRDRLRMAVVEGAQGKPARTHFTTLARGAYAGRAVALLRCDLDTGRTHQIRVHCRHLGHPLLGDAVYARGNAQSNRAPIARQALHAWRLGLIDPEEGTPRGWQAEPPADWLAAAVAVGIPATAWQGAEDADPAPITGDRPT